MKRLISIKDGSTLIEVIVAVLLLTISASAVVSSVVTSDRITREHESTTSTKSRIPYEDAVGTMDKKLNSDTSSESGMALNMTVKFKDGTEYTIANAKKIANSDFKEIAIYTKD